MLQKFIRVSYEFRLMNFCTRTVFNPLTAENDPEIFSLSMYPFTVTNDGIFREVSSSKSEDTVTVQIAPTPCIITAIGENIDNGEILYKLKIKDIKRHEKHVWKSTSDLMKKSEILKL